MERYTLWDYVSAINMIANKIEELLKDKERLPVNPRAPNFWTALQCMRDAWFAPSTPEGDALREKARVEYERIAAEDQAFWNVPAESRKPLGSIDEMLTRLRESDPNTLPLIHFAVGKYGRCDIFWLKKMREGNDALAEFSTWDAGQTLGALRVIDDAVRLDDATVWAKDFRFCYCNSAKTGADRSRLAVPLYERRLDEQERIFKGELKRGSKAFGFFALNGHR
jgi:hypothetical protein